MKPQTNDDGEISKNDKEAQSLSKIVKNVRNWSAHSNLFEDADEKLVPDQINSDKWIFPEALSDAALPNSELVKTYLVRH